MTKALVIAPHPDDETLGCGGTLLRHRAAGDRLHWLIATAMSAERGDSKERIASREREIDEVGRRYGFASIRRLPFATTQLDQAPMSGVIEHMERAVREIEPELLYVPYRGDAHTDHAVVFDAAVACAKWFRFPSVTRLLAYETLSETDFVLNPDAAGFRPNCYVRMAEHLEEKVAIMRIYASEIGAFPFPRSDEAIRALAALRGAAAGCLGAEAFMLLKEVR